MTCWAVIPVKPAAGSKSRLAGALDDAAREALARAMATHVIEAAKAARNVDRVCLVGPALPDFAEGLAILPDPGRGLNPAVASALAEASAQGVNRVVVVAADLPLVTARDIELLAAAPLGEIAIAPDRHGTGTNALSLPLPEARDFNFAYGIDSLALHRGEADRLGLSIELIQSRGLERDIDEPADLPDAADLPRRAD